MPACIAQLRNFSFLAEIIKSKNLGIVFHRTDSSSSPESCLRQFAESDEFGREAESTPLM